MSHHFVSRVKVFQGTLCNNVCVIDYSGHNGMGNTNSQSQTGIVVFPLCIENNIFVLLHNSFETDLN